MGGNYIVKMLEFLQKLSPEKMQAMKGKVSHLHFLHENWCHAFKGGSCDCDPP